MPLVFLFCSRARPWIRLEIRYLMTYIHKRSRFFHDIVDVLICWHMFSLIFIDTHRFLLFLIHISIMILKY